MNKLLGILLVMSLLLISSVSAIKINYYHYKINRDDCRLVLESIPDKYYEGIRTINFYIIPQRMKANYIWNGQVINTFDNCSLTTLIHELAHHKNKMDGINKFHSFNHMVGFRIAEREIWENLN